MSGRQRFLRWQQVGVQGHRGPAEAAGDWATQGRAKFTPGFDRVFSWEILRRKNAFSAKKSLQGRLVITPSSFRGNWCYFHNFRVLGLIKVIPPQNFSRTCCYSHTLSRCYNQPPCYRLYHEITSNKTFLFEPMYLIKGPFLYLIAGPFLYPITPPVIRNFLLLIYTK